MIIWRCFKRKKSTILGDVASLPLLHLQTAATILQALGTHCFAAKKKTKQNKKNDVSMFFLY